VPHQPGNGRTGGPPHVVLIVEDGVDQHAGTVIITNDRSWQRSSIALAPTGLRRSTLTSDSGRHRRR
jgi:hypothetical protein